MSAASHRLARRGPGAMAMDGEYAEVAPDGKTASGRVYHFSHVSLLRWKPQEKEPLVVRRPETLFIPDDAGTPTVIATQPPPLDSGIRREAPRSWVPEHTESETIGFVTSTRRVELENGNQKEPRLVPTGERLALFLVRPASLGVPAFCRVCEDTHSREMMLSLQGLRMPCNLL